MSTSTPTSTSPSPSGRFAIPVAHGQLEAILKEPESPVAAAVVCHPHPLGGGTMNNNVVYRAAKALNEAGLAVLRFNFRGVGASTGRHDGGAGEEEDALAALDLLAQRYPDLPLWMAGFSFGARVGLTVGARDGRIERLLGVGLALRMFDYHFLDACEWQIEELWQKHRVLITHVAVKIGSLGRSHGNLTKAYARALEIQHLRQKLHPRFRRL